MFRPSLPLALLALSVVLLLPEPAGAQLMGGGQQGTTTAASSGPIAAPSLGERLPNPPDKDGTFYRGNISRGPDGKPVGQAQMGWYLPIFKLGLMLGLFFLWARTTWWADDDGKGLRINGEFYNGIILVAGVFGFLLGMMVPNYFGALGLMLVAWGVPLGLYIHERNQHVPESARVMTPKHIQKVVYRTLARVGIHLGGGRETRESALGPPIQFYGKQGGTRGDDDRLVRQAEKSKQFLAAKELVYDAILRRATDIHIEPQQDEVANRYRIDGVMYPAEPFDLAVGGQIINIFKILAAMDITERRKPQDGSFRAELEGRMIDFRVATQGIREGEKMSLRILDQSQSVSRLVDLGMRKQMQDQIREVINQPHGLLLACGPTGAGKSTTLYSLLNELDHSQLNIITVEDPVEYKMEGVNQIEINSKITSFGSSLRSILRQDPDVVMIGEIRDEETAKIGCQAANTGHMVFSTVHANDTISALYRLVDLGVEPFMLSSALSGIIGQRLVRRLCDDCKEAYKPKPELLKTLGLPADKVQHFYRPPTKKDTPCTTCSGIGYKGRLGVYELFLITDRIRDMMREASPVTAVRAEARKNGMLFMKEEGLRLVVKGVTSYEELIANVK